MEITIQILFNSIVSGLILSLVAIGFTYIFRVTKVFHLAHGGIYTAGGLICWWLISMSINWVLTLVIVFFVIALLIYLIEKTIYLPLNKSKSNQSISLIASLGLYVVIINLMALLLGNDNKLFEFVPTGSFTLGQIIVTNIQIVQGLISLMVIFIFYSFLKIAKSNITLQAVSDNETISKVFGINTDRERIKVLIIGSIMAGIAAILQAIDVGIDPHSGMSITLTAAVVAILVTRINLWLIIIFSISIIILQNSVEWFLNAQWRDGITFLLLLIVILFKTEGIISYNLRKDNS